MAHVGDRDHQPEPGGVRLGVDGVVEVARVLAVDRDQRQRAQVLAARAGVARHLAAVAARLRKRLRREGMRQAVRGDRKLDRRVGAAVLGQHPQYAPDRIAVAARLLDDLDHGEVAVARRSRALARHDHALAHAPVVRRHETDAALEREAAGDLLRAPLEHLDDRALGSAAIVAPGDARRRAVAVKQHAHLAVGQEQVVALALVRHQETEAVAVAAHGADDDRQAIQQAVFIRAVDEQLAVARHGTEALGERLALVRVADAEQRGERVEAERLLRLPQLREQQLAARDRLFVARRLLAKARVFLLPSRPAGHGFLEIDIKQVPA